MNYFQAKDPFFSVVISVYNKQDYVQETLESVYSQSYQNFELLIVNDGSTDRSLSVLSKYKDRPQTTLYTISNQGVSHARNFGVKKARAPYVAFLDGDDLWMNDHLEIMRQMILSHSNQLVFGTGTAYQTSKKLNPVSYSVAQQNVQIVDYFKASLQYSCLNSSSVVIKKKVFDTLGGFLEQYHNYEDIEFWFRIGLCYQVVFNPKITTHIQCTQNSLSRNKIHPDSCCFFEAYEHVETKNRAFYQLLHLNWYSLALICKDNRDWDRFKKLYQKIDLRYLSTKKRILLHLPFWVLHLLKKFKKY